MQNIYTLPIDNKARISTVIATGLLHAKMTEMGLLPGKAITVLYKAPFNGPIALDVDGYTLSIRKDEAELILVDV